MTTTSDDAALLTGSRFCRAVRCRVPDAFLEALNCHCSNCRRTTGAAVKPFAGIERAKLTITDGATNLMIYGDAKGHDAHCKGCGSLLYSVVRDGAFVHVTLGTLVDSPSIRDRRRQTVAVLAAEELRWQLVTPS
jgi:hypothetical protein